MTTFTSAFMETSGGVLGVALPLALGWFLLRFLFAVLEVWVETAKYNRLMKEQEVRTPNRIISVERAPNPRYADLTVQNRAGVKFKLPMELPHDMFWRNQ